MGSAYFLFINLCAFFFLLHIFEDWVANKMHMVERNLLGRQFRDFTKNYERALMNVVFFFVYWHWNPHFAKALSNSEKSVTLKICGKKHEKCCCLSSVSTTVSRNVGSLDLLIRNQCRSFKGMLIVCDQRVYHAQTEVSKVILICYHSVDDSKSCIHIRLDIFVLINGKSFPCRYI